MFGADLTFNNTMTPNFSWLSIKGNTAASAAFDDLYIGPMNPLFVDNDNDGMDDAWELAHGLDPTKNDRDSVNSGVAKNIAQYVLSSDPNTDSDGDGVSNLQETLQGTDPFDFYNGEKPIITPLADYSGKLGPNSMIAVRVTTRAGIPIPNAPLQFSTSSGNLLTANPYGRGRTAPLLIRSDETGVARVYVRPANL
jgi:hypothetical protein